MGGKPPEQQVVRFGAFAVDLRAGELHRGSRRVPLQEKPFQLLAALLERPGEVVTREELQQRLWPGVGFHEFDDGLNTVVRKLRQALDDSADRPRYVETLPRRGYRWLAAVDATGPHDEDGALPPPPEAGRAAWLPPNRARLAVWLIVILAVAAAVVVLPLPLHRWLDRATHLEEIRSLVVLPLANLSGDPEQEYFADGMTDELITELARISALRVISRTSAMHFKGTKATLPQIARELGVDAVVEGTVLRAGDRVRITVQLIAAPPERHLWADGFEGDLKDILALQRNVARAVAERIRASLSPQEQARLAARSQVNPEAYTLYLKGMFYLTKQSEEGSTQAIDSLQKATAADPGWSRAWSGLAGAYASLSGWGYASCHEQASLTRAAAEKALELDPLSDDAHVQLAWVSFFAWDWAKAEELFQRAEELNPGSPTAHLGRAYLLTCLRRHEEAIGEIRRAKELDPLSAFVGAWGGRIYCYAHRYDEAIATLRAELELHPDDKYLLFVLASAYVQKGMLEEAIATYLKRPVPTADTNWALGYAYGVAGKRVEAERVLAYLLDKQQKQFIWPAIIAYVYIGLGDKDRAFAWLEKTYDEGDRWIEFLQVDPWFDSLRGDPRFADLVRRMHFPPAAAPSSR